jgi:glycosyltransferase involved in cell wall biosynthesis
MMVFRPISPREADTGYLRARTRGRDLFYCPLQNHVAQSMMFESERPGVEGVEPRVRLLLVGPLPPPYIGPALATKRLLESSVLAKYLDVRFFNTSDADGAEDIGKLTLRNVATAFGHTWRCLRQLIVTRPDAIYVPIARGFWGFLRDIFFLVPARMLGVKVIVHLRAGRFDIIHDDGAIGRVVAAIGLRCVHHAIVLGETLRGVFGDAISEREISVVPNGLPIKGWEADVWQAGRESRQDNTFRIAYLANIYEDKGTHIMLEAIPLILRSIPDLKVRFAGVCIDPTYQARCFEYVREHGLESYVEFVGEVNDAEKKQFLAESDLAVFVPVKPEGLPWVVLEAMAAGLPVIGTPQGTMAEVIVDEETGFIVPSGQPEPLARQVKKLALDAELRWRMGQAGRHRVESHFSEEVSHRRLAEVVTKTVRNN